MVYCRGGDDSDVYALGNNDGYTIIVRKGTVDKDGEVVEFNHQFAGQEWQCSDLRKFFTTMLMLRTLGLKIPQHALDSITKEIKEQDSD